MQVIDAVRPYRDEGIRKLLQKFGINDNLGIVRSCFHRPIRRAPKNVGRNKNRAGKPSRGKFRQSILDDADISIVKRYRNIKRFGSQFASPVGGYDSRAT